MKTLNDICLDLENSKKLKENGIEIESLCHWRNTNNPINYDIVNDNGFWKLCIGGDGKLLESKEVEYPAPTLQELLELLPLGYGLKKYSDFPREYHFNSYKFEFAMNNENPLVL